MTLRGFLFATQALMAEEGLGFKVDTKAGEAQEPSPADVRERNAQSMQMIQGLMAGVKGAPKVGGGR